MKKALKGLFLGLVMMVGGNTYAGPGEDNFNSRSVADGQVITLCGSNGRFLSSENAQRTMRCNRTSIGAWERFTVDKVGVNPDRFRLIASNGRFVRVQPNNRLRANGDSTSEAAIFIDSTNNPGGQHSLNTNGVFLSSENGTQSVRANRNSVGAWERWDVSGQ